MPTSIFRISCLLAWLAPMLVACVHEPVPCVDDPDSEACMPWICCMDPSVAGCDAAEVMSRCVSDGGVFDGGVCLGGCTGALGVCDESVGECVECTSSDTSACVGERSFCDVSLKTCVGCLERSDCTEASAPVCRMGSCEGCESAADCPEASAPVCTAGRCEGCATNADCASFGSAAGICSEGRCVECVASDESACDGNRCDAVRETCTDTPVGSVLTCESCVADSECGSEHRCIPMDFAGEPAGHFCMRLLDAGCERPYATPLVGRASLSGARAATYCGIAEAAVSCAAVRALQLDRACDGPDDASRCMAPGALCRTVGTVSNRCTYLCGGNGNCPNTYECNVVDGHCG